MDRRSFLRAGAGTAAVAAAGLAVGAAASASPWPSSLSAAKWDRLRANLHGRLLLPGDAPYDEARKLAAAQFDTVYPQAVAQCTDPRDVATCIKFAQDNNLASAVRSGGHNFLGWSTSEGLVIDVSTINHVKIGRNSVHLGPGAQAVDVASTIAPHGLSVPAGFCASVCPGGFVTGGGMGWQFRKYGPACDRLLSARVVLADGRLVTASEHENADLYWALRGGGGGNFGVVVDFEMDPTTVTHVGYWTLTWPFPIADHVLHSFQEWSANASLDLAPRAGILLNNADPSAKPVVIVTGVHFGDAAALDADLNQLVSLVGSAPATRVVDQLSYQQALMRQFGCENDSVEQCHLLGTDPEAILPRQAFVLNRTRMFDQAIPETGFAEIAEAFDADRRTGQYRWLGFLALGGNANNPAPGDTAYVHRKAQLFSVFTAGLVLPNPTSEDNTAAVNWARGGFNAIDKYSNGHTYVNYPDIELSDYANAYYGSNLPRLSAVKRHFDPHGFFKLPQGIRAHA